MPGVSTADELGLILPWAPRKPYQAGQPMIHNGATFTRNATGISRRNFDATEAALWTQLPGAGGGSATVILPWAANTAYATGQPMTQGGVTYTRNSAGTSRASFDGTEAALWTALPLGSGGGAGLPKNVRSVSANATAVGGDLLLVDATAGAVTITSPASAAVGDLFTVVKTDSSANAVAVTGTINGDAGGASITSKDFGAVIEAVSTGPAWRVTSVTAPGVGPKGDQGIQGIQGVKGDTGNAGAAGAIAQIQDEGSNLPVETIVNFVGAGVTATDVGGKTVVTIPGGGRNDGLFGTGADGAVHLDGTVGAPAWATKSGSTYTMTADVNATTILIDSGVTVVTAGYRFFYTVSFTNNGTVSYSTAAANGAAAGTAGAGVAAGVLPSQTAGAGNTGAGAGGTAAVLNGSSGAGGLGSSGAGGAGIVGQLTSVAKVSGIFSQPSPWLAGVYGWNGPNAIKPGSSGGGGGGDGTVKGGGGGAGGGGMLFIGPSFTNNGTISCAGGNGGSPASGNAGGGGGGTGGMIAIFSSTTPVNTGTISVAGGTGGTPTGTGVAGSSGAAGLLLSVTLS